jgi:hypothetical protein
MRPSRTDIDAIVAFLPALESGPLGDAPTIETTASDVVVMPSTLAAPMIAFHDALYEHGFVLEEDWLPWTREVAFYSETHDAIDVAELDVLLRILTVIVRQDRFVDGLFLSALEDGLVARIVRRLRDIAGEAGA